MENDIYKGIKYKNTFRDYQLKVLSHLDFMMNDKRLHVTAAPGAGKTILGLEVIRMLGKRALIFVPTINLRNQWKERFMDSFVPEESTLEFKSWWEGAFSTDLEKPGIITCATYQALWSYGGERLAEDYKNLGIDVVCLDEAHHLKREWWKTLTEFIDLIKPTLISLTATPPIDTSNLEWKRYIQLCGEIDIEISIPEMVFRKCLCPHQDYLYICRPSAEEQNKVNVEIARNMEAMKAVLGNPNLYREVKELAFLKNPSENMDAFLKYPDYLDHIISYMTYVRDKHQVEFEGDRFVAEKALEIWDKRIQEMLPDPQTTNVTRNMTWFIPFMRDVMENDPSSYSRKTRDQIEKLLSENHMFVNGKVTDRYSSEKYNKILTNSITKLDAMEEIVRQESSSMGDNLRCLILMDRIRKEDMSKVETEHSLTDMGVSTAFERLRRQEHMGNLDKYFAPVTPDNPMENRIYKTRLGVLTGSLVILPDPVMEEMLEATDFKGSVKKLGLTGYSLIDSHDNDDSAIVLKVTELFSAGRIQILIGTSSLLGEGWDAPAVNTLIIGSTSATYVKTNQMRGRALRILADDKDKVSNIWHLMSYAGNDPNCSEIESMRQRFDSIVGLSMDGKRIENGIARLCPVGMNLGFISSNLKMTNNMETSDPISLWNHAMLSNSINRQSVAHNWHNASYTASSQVRNVVNVNPKKIGWKDSWFNIGYRIGLKDKDINNIANAIIRTLKYKNMIEVSSELKKSNEGEYIGYYLDNATERDSRIFAECMSQALSPIICPKYIVCIGMFFKKYLSVPDIFAKKKDIAECFVGCIRKSSRLILANSPEGKEIIIRQRLAQGTLNYENIRTIRKIM
ncbi:MAG: DEAD/DEAH box helicase family protein [Eubacterium sp.]|nr:DEAD/DEAH box helicase family protein [Eubacterium sp.]